jgi:hypothetical protein
MGGEETALAEPGEGAAGIAPRSVAVVQGYHSSQGRETKDKPESLLGLLQSFKGGLGCWQQWAASADRELERHKLEYRART